MTILAIAIPLLLGLLVSSVTLLKNHRFGEWLLVFSLAPGIGIAIPSLLYFIYFILFRPNYPLDIYVGLEVLAVFVLLAGFILSIRNRDKINFACIRLLFGRKFWRKDGANRLCDTDRFPDFSGQFPGRLAFANPQQPPWSLGRLGNLESTSAIYLF